MKLARMIAAPVAAAAIVIGSTVGVAGVASAEPAPAAPDLEAFAKQLGINTTIGGFAGTALGAGVGCALGAGVGSAAPIAGSVAGCLGGGALGGLVAGAGVGGIIGTVIGGASALPMLFPAG